MNFMTLHTLGMALGQHNTNEQLAVRDKSLVDRASWSMAAHRDSLDVWGCNDPCRAVRGRLGPTTAPTFGRGPIEASARARHDSRYNDSGLKSSVKSHWSA